jgi:hypothetical protein
MMSWTMVIMVLANMAGISGGMTHVSGYTSREYCEAQARQIQSVRVDGGARRILTLCVEVQ